MLVYVLFEVLPEFLSHFVILINSAFVSALFGGLRDIVIANEGRGVEVTLYYAMVAVGDEI